MGEPTLFYSHQYSLHCACSWNADYHDEHVGKSAWQIPKISENSRRFSEDYRRTVPRFSDISADYRQLQNMIRIFLLTRERVTNIPEKRPMSYRKIPIISPGLIFVQKAFLLSLFSGELIFGGAYIYYWVEFCVSKWVWVINKQLKALR